MKLNTRLSNMFFSALVMAAIIFMFAVSIFAQPTNWLSPTILAPPSGGRSVYGIAGSGNIVHAVHGGNEPDVSTIVPCGTPSTQVMSTSQILYARSTNQDLSSATSSPISFPLPSPSPSPNDTVKGALYLEDNVMADGNTVAVVYYNGFTLAKDFFPGFRTVGSIYVVVSQDGGGTWEAPLNLTQTWKVRL